MDTLCGFSLFLFFSIYNFDGMRHIQCAFRFQEQLVEILKHYGRSISYLPPQTPHHLKCVFIRLDICTHRTPISSNYFLYKIIIIK